MPWLILALLGGTAFLYGAATENALLCLFTKPLPVIALLLWLRAPTGAGSPSACCCRCSATYCWPGRATCSSSA